MTETKFCKYCKWCQRVGLLKKVTTYAKCLHPVSRPEHAPDIVTGEVAHGTPEYCNVMRLTDAPCGPSGDLFEPRR